jgi:EXLDI family protein
MAYATSYQSPRRIIHQKEHWDMRNALDNIRIDILYFVQTMQRWSISMPNKTIYVPDEDLPVFERAQAIAGGSLSATIVQALRDYIAAQEARERGFHVVELEVGTITSSRKRFTGRLIAEAKERGQNGDASFTKYAVYLTPKGNLAVYQRHVQLNDRGAPPKKQLDVYGSADALQGQIPDELYQKVVQSLQGDTPEVLDI